MTLWAFLGFRLGFVQLYSLYECVIWCTIIQTSLILVDKLTPSPLAVSVVFFSFAASQCRVSTVPEHQNDGRMMDGKTNTLLLWSIRVGLISFNLWPISKERNIVWRNIFPASELPPARDQCQGSVNRQSRGSAPWFPYQAVFVISIPYGVWVKSVFCGVTLPNKITSPHGDCQTSFVTCLY